MRAWIVGVEKRTYERTYGQTTQVQIVWHTESTHRENLPPHRTNFAEKDELSAYLEFLRRCEKAGIEMGEPPCVSAERN